MQTVKKRSACLVLALCLALSLCAAPLAAQEAAAQQAQTASYVYRTTPEPEIGSIGGEWAVLALSRGGFDAPQSYWDGYYSRVEEAVAACGGVLHERKYTEYARVALALTAIGANPRNVAGYDLLAPLGDFDKTVWQGVNGAAWALLALDSGGYAVPQNDAAATQATRQMYVEELLGKQLESGGWSLGGGAAEADLTAMVLQALAPYRAQSAVAAAVERGLSCLSALQRADGGFESGGVSTAESAAQVVLALCALGVEMEDARFVKNGNSPLSALLSFAHADGGFCHTLQSAGSNAMATEQALCALVAAQRAAEGKSSFYQMDDVTLHTAAPAANQGLSAKHPDVRTLPVTAPGATFSDMAAHPAREAVEWLAERGILNGKGNGAFDPAATMTRAEFCAAAVRALGLSGKADNAFSDVPQESWYAPYVGAANSYGLVTGVGEGRFAPMGTITRQEAAVLLSRAAALCGMDTARTATEIRNTLAPFGDYRSVSAWAQSAVAFCVDAGLWDDDTPDLLPRQEISRAEVAQMLYQLLWAAKLAE